MAKNSFSRRGFLQISALGSSAALLSSCTSLDRFVMGDERDLDKGVLILGAGAAGLAAAFELKKREIPFRVLEASSRVGGRVLSTRLFPGEEPVAELGAEFIEPHHRAVFAMAKELNLPLKEIRGAKGFEAHYFSFRNQIYNVRDLASKVKSLEAPFRRVRQDLFRGQDVILSSRNASNFERAAHYDSLSLADLLKTWKGQISPELLSLIEVQAISRFGVEARDQSSLHFLSTLDSEGSSLLSGRSFFRMDGGLSSLMEALYQRVAGVIPDEIVVRNAIVEEIEEKKGVFSVYVRTPSGLQRYRSRHVICALPFSCLKLVKGLKQLEFSQAKLQAIESTTYASHSKGTVAFSAPFWRKPSGRLAANLGNFTGDFLSQKLWDSGRGQPGQMGLLTFQRGGNAGLMAGDQVFDETRRDLQLFYRDLPPGLPQGQQLMNWTRRPWSRGSMVFYRPGHYLKLNGMSGESEYDGRFLFAGEHTSLAFAGTLQGALESGKTAAAAIKI